MTSPVETLQQFYQRTRQALPAELAGSSGSHGHFNVQKRGFYNRITPYNRRDYYKICLALGKGRLHFADHKVGINQPAIFFSNPTVPSSWQSISEKQAGFYCLFNDSFISDKFKRELQPVSALFNPAIPPVLLLNNTQVKLFSNHFIRMSEELKGDYAFKYDVIRSILKLLIHEGVKIGLQEDPVTEKNAQGRISTLFSALLEQQFPVDSPENPLKFRSPSEFAEQLGIHVNHLNHIVKIHTGNTTTQLISNRIIAEAETLLQNTNWDIAEIGYCLRFDYPSHFNSYFKRHTGITPRALKQKRKHLFADDV